jgi:nucleotide-binding universal stress UspA family protein
MPRARVCNRIPLHMSADLIISYDGTPNDDDALALGKLLALSGARPALAYVRHAREFDPGREEIASHDADRRLESGAAWFGEPAIPRHVVISSSTGEGLIQLAHQEGASVVVFGSDYRTPPGRAEPGNTAQRLLDGGPVAVAVAAAGLRARAEVKIESIAVFGPGDDAAVAETARSLADKLGATVNPNGAGRADLIVVGSPPSGGPGRTGVSGLQRSVLNSALGSVLVLPYGKPLVL